MQDDPRETIRRLAALAGMPLSEERIAALSAVDYREAEPAGRFRPRPEAPQ